VTKRWTGYRSILGKDIQSFLTHNRALGKRFEVEERALQLLDRYLTAQGIKTIESITPELIERFLLSRPRKRPRSFNHLLCTVRRLFDWMVNQDLIDQSPVKTKSRRQTSQRIPFIFDQPAARRLFAVAKSLPDRSRTPLRGLTYYTIFALLYALGLRVGEVCRLKIGDVDFDKRLLLIRKTKFYKSRLVPFGPKIELLLREYLCAVTKRRIGIGQDSAVFSVTSRGEIHPCTVSQTFHHLVPQLKLEVPPGCSPPRLHDLRHSFAVGTLLRWYREGIDPGTELLKLSTFLGHVDMSSTAVYLTITTSLLLEANRRFETYARSSVEEVTCR
jgi:site-specific recombinase XerD